LLPHREVRYRLRIFADLANHRGADDADNLEQVWFLPQSQTLSERVLPGHTISAMAS